MSRKAWKCPHPCSDVDGFRVSHSSVFRFSPVLKGNDVSHTSPPACFQKVDWMTFWKYIQWLHTKVLRKCKLLFLNFFSTCILFRHTLWHKQWFHQVKNTDVFHGHSMSSSSSLLEPKNSCSVQSLSCVRLFATPWIAARQASLSSQTPRVYSNSRPSSRWCHPAISSSVVPFSSCPQSLPASGSFPMSQLLAWGSQSIGVSASASVLPRSTQDWSPLGWTGWISLQSKELSRGFSNTTVQKHPFFWRSAFFTV